MTSTARVLIVVLALLALAAGVVLWRGEASPPEVSGPAELHLGRAPTTAVFTLRDAGSGLRSARVTLSHARGSADVAARQFGGNIVLGGGPGEEALELTLDAGAMGLKDGDAFLRIEVTDWSWRGTLGGNRVAVEVPVSIDLTPPRVSVDSGLTYVNRGGAAAVSYRVSDDSVRDGVMVGDAFFPGYPWPGGGEGCDLGSGTVSPCRVAVFAVPVDAPPEPPVRVVAEDAAGNTAIGRWATRVQEREFPDEPIRLPPSFLNEKVPDLARTLGIDASDPLAAFQDINTRVRAENEARIRELVTDTSPQPLWQGGFRQLRNSKVTSRFAEKRRYLVEGEVVSRATHYGFDLASTAHAPITAANAGRVIFAGDLGIYGNCVLVDHGLGVVTLYGHLSRLDVSAGDRVEKGSTLGLSGATGLAGGDHLHFAVLVSGTYVDPREWFDARWVREHVEVRLGER